MFFEKRGNPIINVIKEDTIHEVGFHFQKGSAECYGNLLKAERYYCTGTLVCFLVYF